MVNAVTYKRHPTYLEYFVGDNGSIFSLKEYRQPVRFLKPSTSGEYDKVTIFFNGERLTRLVHRLVVQTFIGLSESVVNHKDRDKRNNSIENLEYCNHQENSRHGHQGKKRFITYNKKDDNYFVIIQLGKGETLRAGKMFKTEELAYEAAHTLYTNHFGFEPWSK